MFKWYKPSSRNKKKYQINNLAYHLKDIKGENTLSKAGIKKEIKFREKVNKIEIENIIEKIKGKKELFFENINTNDKPLASLTKKNISKIQIHKYEKKEEK